MINVFKKLEIEGLLAPAGNLLDLGSGPGKLSEPLLSMVTQPLLLIKIPEFLLKHESVLQLEIFKHLQ